MVKHGLSDKFDLNKPVIVDEDTTEIEPSSKGKNARQQIQVTHIPDNLTDEQFERDKQTTKLYEQFVKSHRNKQKFIRSSKKLILYFCLGWVTALIIACVVFPIYVLSRPVISQYDIISLISTIVPLIGAILGTLNIVTKYVFPKSEERYITKLVRLIHKNDLKNKRVNIKAEKTAKHK